MLVGFPYCVIPDKGNNWPGWHWLRWLLRQTSCRTWLLDVKWLLKKSHCLLSRPKGGNECARSTTLGGFLASGGGDSLSWRQKRGSRRALPTCSLTRQTIGKIMRWGETQTRKGGYRPYFGCLSPFLPTRLASSTTSCLHCFELTRVCA